MRRLAISRSPLARAIVALLLSVVVVGGVGSTNVSAATWPDDGISVSGQIFEAGTVADDAAVDDAAAGDSGGASVIRAAIGAAVMIGVFVFGLTRIREQRRTGRTSKFPRIG